jgi:lysine/ornithine N-monooxygenase
MLIRRTKKQEEKLGLEYYKASKIRAMREKAEIYKKYESPEYVDMLLAFLINEINSTSEISKIDAAYQVFDEKVMEAIFESTYRQNSQHYYQQNRVVNNSTTKLLKVLGLSEDVRDFNIIRRQYLKLIKKYHPDNLDFGDLEKSQTINEAYNQVNCTPPTLY